MMKLVFSHMNYSEVGVAAIIFQRFQDEVRTSKKRVLEVFGDMLSLSEQNKECVLIATRGHRH